MSLLEDRRGDGAQSGAAWRERRLAWSLLAWYLQLWETTKIVRKSWLVSRGCIVLGGWVSVCEFREFLNRHRIGRWCSRIRHWSKTTETLEIEKIAYILLRISYLHSVEPRLGQMKFGLVIRSHNIRRGYKRWSDIGYGRLLIRLS